MSNRPGNGSTSSRIRRLPPCTTNSLPMFDDVDDFDFDGNEVDESEDSAQFCKRSTYQLFFHRFPDHPRRALVQPSAASGICFAIESQQEHG